MTNWERLWNEDIDFLEKQLIEGHKNLFFSISSEEFKKKVVALRGLIKDLDYEEMKIELSRLVASIRDAHTSIIFPIKRYLPVSFYYFKEGIYITKIIDGYQDLIYKRVEKINDIDIKDVLSDLKEIISYENEYLFNSEACKYMQFADVLYGLLVCDSIEEVKLSLDSKEVTLKTVELSELKYIENRDVPMYMEKMDENLWSKYFSYDNSIYIKYNSCREIQGDSIANKIDNIINFIEEKNIDKLTLDLRHNLGGDSTLIRPLIDYIKLNNRINRKGNLKVIIGRDTFSSALLNAYEFKFETEAIIEGEPSGGKPNCYGEVNRVTLPNSGFKLSYSTKYYNLIDDDKIDAMYPDILIEESIETFRGGI